jgi:hypothetical protein
MYNHLDFTECLNTQLLQVTFCMLHQLCFLLSVNRAGSGVLMSCSIYSNLYCLCFGTGNLIFILECLVYGH